MLLLGAGESGKSTFLKQMRIIHGNYFEPELIREYQHVIYQNLIKGMQVLVDAREIFNIPWTNSARQSLAEEILGIKTNKSDIDIRLLFRQCAPILQDLWQDQAIIDTYDRRREFQIVSKLFLYTFYSIIKYFIHRISWNVYFQPKIINSHYS